MSLSNYAAEFDPRAALTPEDTYASWTKLGGSPPTHTSLINPAVFGAKPGVPSVLVCAHADVRYVLDQPKLFPFRPDIFPKFQRPDLPAGQEMPDWDWMPPTLFGTDPASPPLIRGVVAKTWTRPRLSQQRPLFNASAESLLADILNTGRIELISEFSMPYILRALMVDLLGLPDEACDIAKVIFADSQAVFFDAAGVAPMGEVVLRAVSEREFEIRNRLLAITQSLAKTPERGLVSDLLHQRIDKDVSVTPDQVLNFIHHVVAAIDNPIMFIGSAVAYFADHPTLWAAMVEDRTLTPAYMDEALRLRPALPVLQPRHANEDTEIAGVPVAKGTIIALHVGAANRDPAVFQDPETFDPGRPQISEMLTFSSGPHRCMAPWLGRILVECALEVLIENIPGIRRADLPATVFPGFQDGYETIHFEWDAPPRIREPV